MSSSDTLSNSNASARAAKPTAGMLRLARQIEIEHEPPGTNIHHINADVYLDTHRFEREQLALFRHMPVPVAPAALLDRPGRFIAHDAYGVPLMITRGLTT